MANILNLPDYTKNWIVKEHFQNEKELNELYDEYYNNGGKCYIYSIILFQKLRKIGAKRCRGTPNNTSIMRKSKFNEEIAHHVWVETHNMVYDKSIFRTIIAPKDEWYQLYQISDVEYAEDGIFYKNNYNLNCGPDDINEIKKHLLPNTFLIDLQE
jgi:hypothetical protein